MNPLVDPPVPTLAQLRQARFEAMMYTDSLLWTVWRGGKVRTSNGVIDPTEFFKRHGWTDGDVVLVVDRGVLITFYCKIPYSNGNTQLNADKEAIEWLKAFFVNSVLSNFLRPRYAN